MEQPAWELRQNSFPGCIRSLLVACDRNASQSRTSKNAQLGDVSTVCVFCTPVHVCPSSATYLLIFLLVGFSPNVCLFMQQTRLHHVLHRKLVPLWSLKADSVHDREDGSQQPWPRKTAVRSVPVVVSCLLEKSCLVLLDYAPLHGLVVVDRRM